VADPSETTQVSLGSREPETAELLGAVRALSAQVGGLQAELQALRAQSRALPPPLDAPTWDHEPPAQREKSQWMRTLDRPGSRPPAVPRLLLEVVFLVSVAAAAAIAELEPVVIGLLMAGAWALVAVTEWLSARAAARYAELAAMPLAGASGIRADDPSWFAPPVERTLLEPGETTQDGFDVEEADEPVRSPTRLPPRGDD
jgi:hypothetical protein